MISYVWALKRRLVELSVGPHGACWAYSGEVFVEYWAGGGPDQAGGNEIVKGKSLLLVPQLSRKSAFGPSAPKSDKQAPQLLKLRRFSPLAILFGGSLQ
jgi:hypothetical protein